MRLFSTETKPEGIRKSSPLHLTHVIIENATHQVVAPAMPKRPRTGLLLLSMLGVALFSAIGAFYFGLIS